MLGRVDAEAAHAQIDEIVEIGGDLGLYGGISSLEIGQTGELARAHLDWIVIVVDDALIVEIVAIVERAVVHPRVRRAAAADAGNIGHVIDDRVGVNIDADGLAARDHVGEGGAVAAAAGKRVAHGLIALPPGIIEVVAVGDLDDGVLHRRGDEHRAEAVRAEPRLALLRDIGPAPLEEADGGRAGQHQQATVARALRHLGGKAVIGADGGELVAAGAAGRD